MDYEKMSFAYRKLFQSLNKIEGFREGFVEPQIDVEEIQKLAESVKKREACVFQSGEIFKYI